jgi:hypothetical protein
MNSLKNFILTLLLTEGARRNRDSGDRFLRLAQFANPIRMVSGA